MSQIRYGTKDILYPQPTPLVSKTVQPYFDGAGRRLGESQIFRLEGQITGVGFSTITGAMAELTAAFSRDFLDLVLDDGDGYTITGSGCLVNSIQFAQSVEDGLQAYTVELESRPVGFFLNAGISDKRNSWSVSQGEDGNFSISHEMFAKGINTAPSYDNAFDNAKNFVLTLTGFNPPPLFPFFISSFSGSLDNRVENINRFEGAYTLTESYIGSSGSKVAKTITVDLESGNDGIISVTVRGDFRLGKGEDYTLLRAEYSGFNSFSAATGAYDAYRGVSGLLQLPVFSGVEEDRINNSLSFEVGFNDWPTTSYRHDYTVNVTSGNDGIVSASINGSVQGLGKQSVRYDNAYNFYKTLNLFSLANSEFLEYVGPTYPHTLNQYPTATGTTIDRFDGSISYNATWTDKDLAKTGDGVKVFDVSFNKTFPVRVVLPISIINSVSGLDSCDMLYDSRGSMTVNGSVNVDAPKTSIDATGYASSYVNNDYLSGVLCSSLCGNTKTKIKLDSANITQNVNQDSCDFAVTHSFAEPLMYNPNSSYILLTGLRL